MILSLFLSHLQWHTLTRRPSERGETLDCPARHEGLVAAVDLGDRLLDQGNPQLIPLGLKMDFF